MLLPSAWAQAKGILQASHILLWWPRIVDQLKLMKPRECYSPDWNLDAKRGKFKKIEMDFDKAYRRLRD